MLRRNAAIVNQFRRPATQRREARGLSASGTARKKRWRLRRAVRIGAARALLAQVVGRDQVVRRWVFRGALVKPQG